MIHCGEEMVEEMVPKGCVDERLGQLSKPALGLVHVPGGVQHVEAPVPVRPQLVPSVVELGPVVGGGLLYDEHVACHRVDSQPQLDSEEGLAGEATQEQELQPGQEMFRQQLIVSEYDQIVTEQECCRVGEHSEDVGQNVLAPGPDGTFGEREVEQERLHTGDLQVSVGVGVEMMGESVTNLTSGDEQ